MNQTQKKLSTQAVYNSRKQRFARFLHLVKAKYKRKEQKNVQYLGQFIPDNGVILDIGANMGYFSKEFASIHNASCHVYCFEPVSYNYSILTNVMSTLSNATLEQISLSDTHEISEIYIPVKESGKIGPGLAHFGKELSRDYIIEKVTSIPLDDYVKNNNINTIDFIKCDVEGAELIVFKGARGCIEKYKPVVFCEIHKDYCARMGYKPEDIFSFFSEMGYKAYIVEFDNCCLKPVQSYMGNSDYLFKS